MCESVKPTHLDFEDDAVKVWKLYENVNEVSKLEECFKSSLQLSDRKIFLSKLQRQILSDYYIAKRVAFTSAFGTGKTALLKAKSKELLEKDEKVIFVIFSEKSQSLLKYEIEGEFRNYNNFKSLLLPAKNGSSNLFRLVEENRDANFLLDEVKFGVGDIETSDFNSLARRIPQDKYLWLACRTRSRIHQKYLKEFLVPEVKDSGKTFVEEGSPTKKIARKRPHCEDEDEEVVEDKTIYMGLDPTTQFCAAIDQLAFILKTIPSKTIIVIESEDQEIKLRLKQSVVKDRILFVESIGASRRFRKSSNAILVMSKSWFFLRGCDVENLVVFTRSPSRTIVNRIFTRCQSRLIVICNENHALRIVPSGNSNDFAMVIKVHDTTMPESFRESILCENVDKVFNFLIGRNRIPTDIRTIETQTGLMVACARGAARVVQLLLEEVDDAAADVEAVDAWGWSALHYAVSFGQFDCVKLLVENGANVNALNNNRETALQMAEEKSFSELYDVLRKHEINSKDLDICW